VKPTPATEIQLNTTSKKEEVVEGDNSFTALLVGMFLFLLLVIYDFKKNRS
jgi:hypothetical protein